MVHDLSCLPRIVALAKFITILPVPVQRSPAICLLLFHLNGHLCNICQLRIKYGLMIHRRFDFSGKLRSRPMNVGISTKSCQIFYSKYVPRGTVAYAKRPRPRELESQNKGGNRTVCTATPLSLIHI